MSSSHGLLGFLHGLRSHRGTVRLALPVEQGEAAAAHELFQVSTLDALMAGCYDGEFTIGELARHGDFGLGTFSGLDGELVALDGEFYQMRADGSVVAADPEMTTPFAAVQRFVPDASGDLPSGATIRDLAGSTTRGGEFYSIRIDGRFRSIRARAVPRQQKPYVPLVEAASDQAEFSFVDVAGSMVGFRYPDFAAGIGVPGFHLHFISADRAKGGHVLDFIIDRGEYAVDHTSDFHLELPGAGLLPAYRRSGSDRDADVRAVEGLDG